MNEFECKRLEELARGIALNAYAPYSKFRVGVALTTASGKVFTGVNLENASYGLTLCAERSALAAAVSAGEREVVAICVACIDAPKEAKVQEKLPCGACRQWIQELAPTAAIIIAGESQIFQIKDLLPLAFELR